MSTFSTMHHGEVDSNPPFSVIVVYNDEAELEQMLLDGVSSQPDSLYELVMIDNRAGEYESAAAALNEGARQASGDYYVFTHQDVRLESDTWLEDALAYLESLDDVGVAGVAGMTEAGVWAPERARNPIDHGPDRRGWMATDEMTEPSVVQTLDELLLIVPAEVFAEEMFDAETTDGWHCYGVEYCLRQRRAGRTVYTLPLNVWHGSAGRVDHRYYRALSRVAKKYPDVAFVSTTCGVWPLRRWLLVGLWLIALVAEHLPSRVGHLINAGMQRAVGRFIAVVLQRRSTALRSY